MTHANVMKINKLSLLLIVFFVTSKNLLFRQYPYSSSPPSLSPC